MSYEAFPGEALDYHPCRYGVSKLLFRGPKKPLEGTYLAAIGGTETYGRFVASPFPERLETATGTPVVNLGCNNAGLDVFVTDPAVAEVCAGAKLTVIQMTGAQNMSNRFYSVHPRRNDRFLKASPLLQTIYREVDFTEFSFTRHMLTRLRAASAEKFALVEDELRTAWTARMTSLLRRLEGRAILLWLSERHPEEPGDIASGCDPLYVDRRMLDLVAAEALGVVEVVAPFAGSQGMIAPDLDAPAAAGLPGPAVHEAVAAALAPHIHAHL